MIKKAGFGGGCHWCTEAVFAALTGVNSVRQGWISSNGEDTALSEGVLIEFDTRKIDFAVLIAIHLHTHSATSHHSMRGKYRSAVYTFSDEDSSTAKAAIQQLQKDFEKPVITRVLPFCDFRINREESLNYYFSDPDRPFCQTYINPKLKMLLQQFAGNTNKTKLAHLLNTKL